MKKENSVIVIGSGGHATSLAESIVSSGYEIKYFLDENSGKKELLGFDVKTLLAEEESPMLVVAVGDNCLREEIVKNTRSQRPLSIFPKIIHADASISRFSEIGEGAVVLQSAVVGANTTIGDFCIVNTRSSIDHDCHMAVYSSLGPGSVTGGGVRIAERSMIGMGTVIRHSINVGSDVVVGSMSYVNKDCVDETVYYGTPAAPIRKRQKGDPYL
ncbi:MAG: NeuD/PglB/VioB family sugar acetyltransferase [Geminicoccales bacterium]